MWWASIIYTVCTVWPQEHNEITPQGVFNTCLPAAWHPTCLIKKKITQLMSSDVNRSNTVYLLNLSELNKSSRPSHTCDNYRQYEENPCSVNPDIFLFSCTGYESCIWPYTGSRCHIVASYETWQQLRVMRTLQQCDCGWMCVLQRREHSSQILVLCSSWAQRSSVEAAMRLVYHQRLTWGVSFGMPKMFLPPSQRKYRERVRARFLRRYASQRTTGKPQWTADGRKRQ